MPSLLTLPREIRDEILSLVITAVRPTPVATLDTMYTGSPRKEIQDIRYTAWNNGRQILYEPRHPTVNANSLLLTNRQLNDETNDALHRIDTSNNYVIDLVLLCDAFLCPTWLSVPILTTDVNTVRAYIRSPETKDVLISQVGEKHRDLFKGGCGGPPTIVWTFYSVLERFLRCGPVGQLKDIDGIFDRGITIRVLELDFVGLIEEEELALIKDFPGEMERGYKKRYPECGLLRPMWLCQFLQAEIQYLLSMSYHAAAFGFMLYERIGCIRFLLDGKVLKELNLGEILVNLNPSDPFGNIEREQRQAYFSNWKRIALKLRQQRGLPVLFPEDWVESESESESE